MLIFLSPPFQNKQLPQKPNNKTPPQDEIPFLMDLHLFLSRPLRPAPAALDPATVRLALNDMGPEGGSLFGCVDIINI